MNSDNGPDPRADVFDRLAQDGRIAKVTRMVAPDEILEDAHKTDMLVRVAAYVKKHGISLTTIGKQLGIGQSTVSEVLLGRYGAKADKHIKALNNWMELDARRRDIIQSKTFVYTAVANEIIEVARQVSQTCKMGVIYGPSHIGKTFTLESLDDSDRFGNPVLVKIDQAHRSPITLCRLICDRFSVSMSGTFDVLMRRLVKRLKGTMRMIMIDEAERVKHQTLEFIRDIHDHTGCPILLCGKPAIFDMLGFRKMGEFLERMDQLTSRIIIRRDLTQRTRPEEQGGQDKPLFTRDDIRKLIQNANLKLTVTPEAEKWLQSRASTIGCGGFGQIDTYLYLAYTCAKNSGASEINVSHLELVKIVTMEYETIKTEQDHLDDPNHTQIRMPA